MARQMQEIWLAGELDTLKKDGGKGGAEGEEGGDVKVVRALMEQVAKKEGR